MAAIPFNMQVISRKKNCVFCKHWYDPGNSCINQITPFKAEYEPKVRKLCMLRKCSTAAMSCCNKFESKF